MDVICIFKLHKIYANCWWNLGKYWKNWLNSKRTTLHLGAYIEGSLSFTPEVLMLLFNVNYAVWSPK